jgi:hypothetical protein
MNSRDQNVETERRTDAQVAPESITESRFVSEWEVFLLCGQPSPSRKRIELYGPLTESWLHQQPERVKEQLSVLFTRFLESLSGTERAIGAPTTSDRATNHSRETEMLWLDQNKDVIKKFAENWVAIEANQLVAASPDFSTVLEQTRRRGIRVPFIVYVPPEIDSITLDF